MDPNQSIISFLKQIPNRYLRIGDILHLVIRTFFQKAKAGNQMEPDHLKNWAKSIFRKDVEYSKNNPDGRDLPQDQFPPKLLHEYYYNLPNADYLCEVAENKMLKAINNFSTASEFEEIRFNGSKSTSVIEKRFRLEFRTCQATGQIDLCR